MTRPSTLSRAGVHAGERPARSAFWRAAERLARRCTSGELATLADHHQLGQPALAARFRAAGRAMDGHRA
ncbi:hypothetical protein NF681_21495 (plasmid) [Comamonadaceae bacterium OTU4NAUVB1]|jgi:hypothetical protein|nr:hypothetical protein NF681_21495 [Comamonadaceae bacterium OTU4NAUVB1]